MGGMRALGLAGLMLIVAGCGKKDAMAQLSAGDPSICANAEVQAVLTAIVRPEKTADDIAGNKQIDALRFGYATSTLEAFDKSVTKATCNTAVTVSLGPETSDRVSLTFVVSPSAEDSSTFVVEALPNPVAERALGLIAAANLSAAGRAQAERDVADAAARKAKVTRVLTRRWLAGIWREYSPNWGGDFSCDTDAYRHVEFEPSGRFGSDRESGTYTLAEDRLNIDSARFAEDGSTQPASAYALTVYDIDPRANLLTLRADDGTVTTYRRCPRAAATAPAPAATASAAEPEAAVPTTGAHDGER